MAAKSSSQAAIRSFQSDVARIREAPEPRNAQLTIQALAGCIALIFVILFVFKIDRVVSSMQGEIDLTAPPQVYQALDQSIIKTIDVREGMRVAKGQVLATLDPTFAVADAKQLKQQIASLNAQIVRDEAELAGKTPVFLDNGDPDQGHYNELQGKLYLDRLAQYKAQVKSLDEQINQTEATIVKTRNDAVRYAERSKIAGKVEDMRSQLLAKGAGSLLNQLASKDQSIEMQRTVENLQNGLNEAIAQLAALKANREAFIQQWRATASQDLVTAQNTRDAARAQLEKALKHQDLVRMEALDDSIVLSLGKLSIGSVLQPGEKFITAMPVNQPVVAEVKISARDIGFIRVGDPAVIKVDAFSYVQHGVAEGKVTWISENAFWVNEQTNQPQEPYYKVGVSIDSMKFNDVPEGFRLVPGMTLTADIRVGRRTAGTYILEGLVRGWGESMREP